MQARFGGTGVTERAADFVTAAGPHLRRALSDEDVQEALRRSYHAGRRAYERIRGEDPGMAVRRLAGDKELQGLLAEAVAGLRQATEGAARLERKRRRGRVLALVGLVVAVALVVPLVWRLARHSDAEAASA
jgi:hypothetical protein